VNVGQVPNVVDENRRPAAFELAYLFSRLIFGTLYAAFYLDRFDAGLPAIIYSEATAVSCK